MIATDKSYVPFSSGNELSSKLIELGPIATGTFIEFFSVEVAQIPVPCRCVIPTETFALGIAI